MPRTSMSPSSACFALLSAPVTIEAWSISRDMLGHCRCDVGYCSCDSNAVSQPVYELATDVEFMLYASVVYFFFIGLPLLAAYLAANGIYKIWGGMSWCRICRAERRYANVDVDFHMRWADHRGCHSVRAHHDRISGGAHRGDSSAALGDYLPRRAQSRHMHTIRLRLRCDDSVRCMET